ncbi:MAG: CBS domain-containing protein, partial [Candidatus Poseidoniia archaeon]
EIQSIMTPRVVVTSVGAEETVADVMGRLPIMVHGRMPMYEQDIDKITGLVLRNEILTRAAADDFDTTMSDISRNVHYCRHDDSVDNALDILLENKIQLIVVKDQFGGTVGLVTMEDVIETLLGVEIVDESDQEAIEEGVLHEDMRELAKIRYADDEQE